MKDKRDRILIVDDQENNRLVIEDILRKMKCEIKGVESGEIALQLLETWFPDLILMDQMMPGLSGIETTARVKAQARFEQTPIIMVTAKDEVETLKAAFEAGAMDYIIKPVNRITLTARVLSALRTKKAFDEIQLLTQELIEQKKELSNFTHMVSHDLKSPVASAASLFDFFIFRLKEEYPEIWDNEGMKELLIRIPSSFKKMLNFVDTMLHYAMSGQVIGQLKEVNMGIVLQEVLQSFEHNIKEGLAVIHQTENMPTLLCDPIKIGQGWQNLISNAIKYRGERTPVTIHLGWAPKGAYYQFWVEDNGPGIPAQYHEKVFAPFTRMNDEVEGSGIGLATVQRIMQAHQGKIYVESEEGQGAKFIFELPVAPLP
ncbi:response regulator [Deltaproteobacteria bacterium TL4]